MAPHLAGRPELGPGHHLLMDRIRVIRTHVLAIPHRQRYHWAIGAPEGTNNVLVEIETEGGVIGIGDACGTRSAIATSATIETVAPLLVGEDPFRIEWLLGRLYRQGNWSNQRRFANQAFAGIEMALWDICGKTTGQPVASLLGGRVRDRIEWFGFIQGYEPTELADHARQLVERGFTVLYMKVGIEPERDVRAVRAVRQAVGSEVRIRVDANEAWDRLTARRMIRRLGEFDLDWVEQPLVFYDLDGMAELRRSVETPIALDQSVFTDYDVYQACAAGAADVVVVGFHETGGLLSLRKAAAVAAAAGVQLNRHAVIGESGVSTLAALQVLATIPNLTDGNQVMEGLFVDDTITDGLFTIEAGSSLVPSGPGLGVEIDWERVRYFRDLFLRVGQYPN